jgi:O-Antigen ligase
MTAAVLARPLRVRVAERGSIDNAAVVTVSAAIALQPLLRPSGPYNSSPVDVLTVAAIVTTAMWVASKRVTLRTPYVIPTAMIILAGSLAGLVSPLPSTSMIAVGQDVVLAFWTVTMVTVARRPGMIRRIVTVWAYSAAVCSVVLLAGQLGHITAITGVVPAEGNRVLFTFGDPNYAATYWVSSIFVVYAARVPHRAWLRWLVIVLLIWALLLTESNGGIVELLVASAMLALLAAYRRFGVPGALILLLILGTAAILETRALPQQQTWALNSNQPILVNSLGRSDESSAQRSQLRAESLNLYYSDSILGSGPGTTKQLLLDRHYPYAKEAHDDYLAALVERGPLGLLGVAMLVLAAIYRAGRVLRRRDDVPDPHSVPRPAGIVAALLAMGVAGTYYEVLHFRFVWALLALVAVLAMDPAQRRLDRTAAAS